MSFLKCLWRYLTDRSIMRKRPACWPGCSRWYVPNEPFVTAPNTFLSSFTKAEESLGMAMVFTLVSHLRDALSSLVQTRIENQRQAAAERARLEAEVTFAYSDTGVKISCFDLGADLG